jgi:protein-S-isoprenylcysteine O-methyltransferase Ste14
MVWRYLIEGPWIVFVVYWGMGALKTRRTVHRESFASRYVVLFFEVLGFVLLFGRAVDFGVLHRPMLPQSYGLAVAGVVLTWMGIAIALWARWHLGQYWSGRITLKENHKLIRSGPYAYLRHPIYSGIDLAAIGGALAINQWRCALGLVLIILGYWIKARKEEALLSAQFGEAFEEHCQATGFLLPKLWRKV